MAFRSGGESLRVAWQGAAVTAERDVIWWSTAARLRSVGFPLLPTGKDPRHYTVVLADVSEERLHMLADQFDREAVVDSLDDRGTLLLRVLWDEAAPAL